MISLTGLGAGLAVGVLTALVQQQFGIIKMPGHYLVQAYPVIISLSDVLLTAVCVAGVGYLIALLPVRSRQKNWE